VPENIVLGCEPPLLDEIIEGLEELSKDGYAVNVHFLEQDALSLVFTIGEMEQQLDFKSREWRKEGIVSKAIVDHLNI
jgi:hypothetical protein